MVSTSVSIEGDKAYTQALRGLAEAQGKTVAELVRKATDAMYGDQLTPYLDFFRAQRGTQNPQSAPNNPSAEPLHAR